MKKGLNRGFTLIELLVVVAIIGILSGIVLTSLGAARGKARDASAIASMSAMRSEAELALTSSGTYPDTDTLCGVNFSKLITSIEAQVPSGNTVDCSSDGSAWASSVTLNSEDMYCVDSTGFSGVGTKSGQTCTTAPPAL